MNTIALTLRGTRPLSALGTICIAGVAGAAGDLLYAFTFYGLRGISPLRILQSIGSGWFGRASFDMGWLSATAGFVSHFGIVIVAAAIYFFVARHWSLLVRRPWLSGFAFGTAVYVVMNFIVVPLSAAPHFQRSIETVLGELTSHLFFVGVPVALIVRRYYGNSAQR